MAEGGLAIAIDGPASSGKGTVARAVAEQLTYAYVDTGAMYRSVALMARALGISWDDEASLASLAGALDFDFRWHDGLLRVIVDGSDITRAIRVDEIGMGASHVSRHRSVRAALLGRQRELADAGGVVMDGRDIGTVVLPQAQLKIYLDASLDERARRRHDELLRRGESVTLSEVASAMLARDAADSGRDVAPLTIAEDAIVVDTTRLTIPEAIDRVMAVARRRGA